MSDPTPHARRSPMEHERDAGDVSLLDMIARLTEERDALDAAIVAALERLDASLFTNSEHQQAKDILREALTPVRLSLEWKAE